MLTSLGYGVISAINGVEAISLITRHDSHIDLILMDQSMPLKDGITATWEIRAFEKDGTLSHRHPIVALTAVVSLETKAQFYEAGADDFLSKPLELHVLDRTLGKFLGEV